MSLESILIVSLFVLIIPLTAMSHIADYIDEMDRAVKKLCN